MILFAFFVQTLFLALFIEGAAPGDDRIVLRGKENGALDYQNLADDYLDLHAESLIKSWPDVLKEGIELLTFNLARFFPDKYIINDKLHCEVVSRRTLDLEQIQVRSFIGHIRWIIGVFDSHTSRTN